MKKTIVSSIIALSLIVGAALPSFAAAEGIQDTIQNLLAQIALLQDKLRTAYAQQSQQSGGTQQAVIDQAFTDQGMTEQHRICRLLNRNLSRGMSGDDVSSLQEFLREQGHFNRGSTGYFGDRTSEAVGAWQEQEGLPRAGIFGPQSRERLNIWCGNKGRLSVNPQRGSSPLNVAFTSRVQIANSSMVADAGSYKIEFGDGTEYVLPCSGTTAFCEGPHTVQHTYASDGTYTAQLVHFGYYGVGPNEQVVGTVVVHVGAVACTMEYKPVCGLKQVVCITTPCNPVEQTYGNLCALRADSATFQHDGECTGETYGNPENDPTCKAWYDGCNSCSRETPTGPAMCTLRACYQEVQMRPYCTARFSNTSNKPPVISGFSGPSTLNVNQVGTWSVVASDPEGEQLTYRIVWGDEVAYASRSGSLQAADLTVLQGTTYTHSYARAGTYTVLIYVVDKMGNETRTTASVVVGGTTGGGGGTICTADAYQCPNGTWVGRSGPNCQFVCTSGDISETSGGGSGGTNSCTYAGATYAHDALNTTTSGGAWLPQRCCNGVWRSSLGNMLGAPVCSSSAWPQNH